MKVKKSDIHIGIITAIEKEFAAMQVLLEDGEDHFPSNGDGSDHYFVGFIKSKHGGTHPVAVALSGRGTNQASIRASNLLNEFSKVSHIIMTGIAGAVPWPDNPAQHVRLGDIVVSDQGGVVQYGFIENTTLGINHKHPPRPPSAKLLKSVQRLRTQEYKGYSPWRDHIEQAIIILSGSLENPQRPPDDEDKLYDSVNQDKEINHPEDIFRKAGIPRVHYGPIASANTLLKNPTVRDYLRDKFWVKAVEMEGSGVADATWDKDKAGYLIIRGACDYCDEHKNFRWQMYASVVAAAYTRAVIEELPVPGSRTPKPLIQPVNESNFFERIERELKMNTTIYFKHLSRQPKKGSNHTRFYFREQPTWLHSKFDSLKSKINSGKLRGETADEIINELDELREQLNKTERLLQFGLEIKHDHKAALTVLEALHLARVDLNIVYNQVWETRGKQVNDNLINSMSELGRQIEFLRQLMFDFKTQTPVTLVT
jgi:nucleoside phosphorylase